MNLIEWASGVETESVVFFLFPYYSYNEISVVSIRQKGWKYYCGWRMLCIVLSFSTISYSILHFSSLFLILCKYLQTILLLISLHHYEHLWSKWTCTSSLSSFMVIQRKSIIYPEREERVGPKHNFSTLDMVLLSVIDSIFPGHVFGLIIIIWIWLAGDWGSNDCTFTRMEQCEAFVFP